MISPFDRRSVVVVVEETDPRSGKKRLVVSHGIDQFGRQFVMPQIPPDQLGAKFDQERGEWMIY